MIQQVWQAHLLHLPKQKNHIAHALCTHLHMLLHLFPLPMKQSYKGSPSLSLSPSYPLGLFLSLPDFFTFQTYISTKVPKYPRFCLQSSPLGYSYHTIFFSTEKKETGWPLVRMVSNNDRTYLKEEQVWKSGQHILSRPDEPDRQDKDLLTQPHLEQINSNPNFRNNPHFSTTL